MRRGIDWLRSALAVVERVDEAKGKGESAQTRALRAYLIQWEGREEANREAGPVPIIEHDMTCGCSTCRRFRSIKRRA